ETGSMFFSFFFQAEDGIRDATVTGVQTCALPISIASKSGTPRGFNRPRSSSSGAALGRSRLLYWMTYGILSRSYPCSARLVRRRSEERRVGKEGRSRL